MYTVGYVYTYSLGAVGILDWKVLRHIILQMGAETIDTYAFDS